MKVPRRSTFDLFVLTTNCHHRIFPKKRWRVKQTEKIANPSEFENILHSPVKMFPTCSWLLLMFFYLENYSSNRENPFSSSNLLDLGLLISLKYKAM